jgi:hypothetical protein
MPSRPGMARWCLVAVGALACAGVLSLSAWTEAPNWRNADSLFYQSMSFEIDGMSAQAARARVFDSPLARPAIAQESSVGTLAWQTFESQFSRRRWFVPALTAVVRPIAGLRALPDVAIVGYLVFGVMLSLLLASRFAVVPSLAVTILCLALGPLACRLCARSGLLRLPVRAHDRAIGSRRPMCPRRADRIQVCRSRQR